VEGLLEREDELGALTEAVDEAAAGRGRLVLLAGEAGIGKSSLVRALRDSAGDPLTFLIGACEPLSVPVPLAPWRELAEAAGADDLTQLGSDDRLVLVRAVVDALSRRSPVVAVIEDAQWADPLTLDLIRLLARRLEQMAAALIVTYRDDEVAANPPLRLLLGDLSTAPSIRRVALQPLSPSAVRELADPQGLDPARLVRVTGGNPFLVVEAIAAGELLPASVRDAVLARAGRLSPAACRAVEAAAVIGQRMDPRLLAEVANAAPDTVEEALAGGVLIADGPVLGFRHELTREAIEESLSPPRRAALHARVFSALAEQPGEVDGARLAHHAELGGLAAQACRYAMQAASEAQRVGALREVQLQTERALKSGGRLAPDERFELLVQLSRAENFSSTRLEDSESTAREAVALAEQLADPVREGRALVLLAWALWSLDRVTEAKAAAERAIGLLEPAGDAAALARALSTHIRMEATAFDPEVAIRSGPRALELAAAAALEEIRIDIETSVALAHGHRGDKRALPLLGDALTAANKAGLTIQIVRAYVNSIFLGAILREHAFVDTKAEEALAVFGEYGATIPGYAVEVFKARSLLDRGRWDEALAIATRPDRDWFGETPVARSIEAVVHARRGADHARTLLQRTWEEIQTVPESSRHGAIRTAVVEAAWLAGDHAAARRELHAAARSPAASRFARSGGELALWAGRYGIELQAPAHAPRPIELELEGDWRAAIREWTELEAPYEAALAALPGDDRAAREALRTFHRLGATASARAFSRERAIRGAPAARGPRRSTLANPAGLTRREQEVLEVLATGATNPAIAASLHLSERTVAHHVSAILTKLGAHNRLMAVERARTKGLLAQDRQAGEPT
jgi:DNA-binding CsgD family transcriptional regulator/tetratricopeptide (TPR) repeat protein